MKNLIVLVVVMMMSLNNFAGKLNPVYKYTSPSLEEIKKFAEGTSVTSTSYKYFLIMVVKNKVGYNDVDLDYIFSHLTKQIIPDTLKAFTYGNSGVDPVTKKMVPCGGHKNLTEAWVFTDTLNGIIISFPLIKIDCANILLCEATIYQTPVVPVPSVPAPPVNNYVPQTQVQYVQPREETLGYIEPYYSTPQPRWVGSGAVNYPAYEDNRTLGYTQPYYNNRPPVGVNHGATTTQQQTPNQQHMTGSGGRPTSTNTNHMTGSGGRSVSSGTTGGGAGRPAGYGNGSGGRN